MLRYSFVAIISGSHAVMLLRYITKTTVGGLLCQLLNMIVVQMFLLLVVGLLLDSCGCLARCGCLDAILLLITVGCLDFCCWFATCGCLDTVLLLLISGLLGYNMVSILHRKLIVVVARWHSTRGIVPVHA